MLLWIMCYIIRFGCSLERVMWFSAFCVGRSIVANRTQLIFLADLSAWCDFEINEAFAKRKHNILFRRRLKHLYIFSYTRPNFPNPHHVCSVARHVYRLTAGLQMSPCYANSSVHKTTAQTVLSNRSQCNEWHRTLLRVSNRKYLSLI